MIFKLVTELGMLVRKFLDYLYIEHSRYDINEVTTSSKEFEHPCCSILT